MHKEHWSLNVKSIEYPDFRDIPHCVIKQVHGDVTYYLKRVRRIIRGNEAWIVNASRQQVIDFLNHCHGHNSIFTTNLQEAEYLEDSDADVVAYYIEGTEKQKVDLTMVKI